MYLRQVKQLNKNIVKTHNSETITLEEISHILHAQYKVFSNEDPKDITVLRK